MQVPPFSIFSAVSELFVTAEAAAGAEGISPTVSIQSGEARFVIRYLV